MISEKLLSEVLERNITKIIAIINDMENGDKIVSADTEPEEIIEECQYILEQKAKS